MWRSRRLVRSMACAAALGLATQASAQVGADRAFAPTMRLGDGVVLQSDITYSVVRGHRPLTMDIYRPARVGPAPVVVFLHGGGWESGSRRDSLLPSPDGAGPAPTSRLMAWLAGKGYVVASISYRLSAEAKYPAPVQDLNAAIRFLRREAGAYGIDPARVITWGASAGVPIALNQAFDCRRRRLDAEPTAPEACPRAVVDWYGPADFAAPYGGAQLEAYLGCRRDDCPETFRQASSIHSVSERPPPVFILHGEGDKPVPIAQSLSLAEALKAKGGEVQLVALPGAEHGLRGASPENLRRALAEMLDFLAANSRPQS